MTEPMFSLFELAGDSSSNPGLLGGGGLFTQSLSNMSRVNLKRKKKRGKSYVPIKVDKFVTIIASPPLAPGLHPIQNNVEGSWCSKQPEASLKKLF